MWILAVQCVFVVAASLLGGWIMLRLRLTHTSLQLVISFVGGLMLGIGVFHMIPHALHAAHDDADFVTLWVMIGIVTIFFLLRAFHFHHHDTSAVGESLAAAGGELSSDASVPQPPADDDAAEGSAARPPAREVEHGHERHGHEHADANEHGHSRPGIGDAAHDHGRVVAGHVRRHGTGHHEAAGRGLRWAAVAAGLSLHTLIDGGVLAAGVFADLEHALPWWQVGLGPFLAVLLHKPLDAVSITSLMPGGARSTVWQHAVNFGFALMCPIGAVAFAGGLAFAPGVEHHLLAGMLAFSAGVFLCLSMSDLLPELEMHSHDRIPLSACLLAGIGVAYAISWLEPEHLHG